ncbi:MAG TPA: tRNA (adenosine(37)-N6)-threonylcarbamoyltransferase complex dimerization subunit type 1 TsaB [Candidatus Saccharibacteria bacterium]|nr:tRNA (adenosine(37)-N6)-threonylcarbamoyltransferase complex dimerization subunit type 1 TsaB [Candidatus Saccharibacteria bacterium]
MILSLRSDNPDAEIAMFDSGKKIDEIIWVAHRELGNTIHIKIRELLEKHKLELRDLTGIICYKGPGSFTGLRIGLTVLNTMAIELQIPIVGQTGPDWQAECVRRLDAGDNDELVMPEYGRDPHITQQKK